MSAEAIERDLKKKITEQIGLRPEGVNRYRVLTPFRFDDGDHIAIVLKRAGERWLLSDEGHTFMHLTYRLDERSLQSGTRQKVIDGALNAFQVEDRGGELVLPVEDGAYGDALYSFVQALLKVSDVSFLTREIVRSAFLEDFREFMAEHVPEPRRQFDWHDPVRDPQGIYPVDCRVNNMPRPLFVFALPGDDKVRDATVVIHQFQQWKVPHHSIGVFEDQEAVNRKVLARFSDVVGKQFSSLDANRDRIAQYVQESLTSWRAQN